MDENISDKDVPGPSTNKKRGGRKAAVAMVTIPKYHQHEHTEVINGNNFESYTVLLEVKTTHDFAGHTSIHGIGNIFDGALGIYDRLLWLVVGFFLDRDKILRPRL